MWGKEEAMKKWIWKHDKKARTQRTEQKDSMENRKNFISEGIQSQDVRRTSNQNKKWGRSQRWTPYFCKRRKLGCHWSLGFLAYMQELLKGRAGEGHALGMEMRPLMDDQEPGRGWLLRPQNKCTVPMLSLCHEVLKSSPNTYRDEYVNFLWGMEGNTEPNDLHAKFSFTALCHVFLILGTTENYTINKVIL